MHVILKQLDNVTMDTSVNAVSHRASGAPPSHRALIIEGNIVAAHHERTDRVKATPQ